MSSKLHIIASCTHRKFRPVPANRQLRAVSASSLKERARRWCRELRAAEEAEFVEAEGLYAGHHWTVVRELRGIAQRKGWHPEMWVASAGYGLVPFGAPIASYSATFAGGVEDSVSVSGIDQDADWWALLKDLSPAVLKGRSSVAELARRESRATILVIASPAYVWAMREDLSAAAAALRNWNQLIIFSSAAATESLAANLVPCTAALLQRFQGGTRLSLHARAARYVLSANTLQLSATCVKARFDYLARRTQPPPTFNRRPLTDEEVQRFICQAWKSEPSISCSRTLRRLRDSGQACEQKRFKRLFEATRGQYASH